MLTYVSKRLINLGTKLSPNHKNLAWILPEANEDDRRILEVASRITMTDKVAQWAFIQALTHIHEKNVPGDIVECGVWKGGNLVIAGLMRQRFGFEREIWGYDTFAGMTPPGDVDVKPGTNLNTKAKFKQSIRGDVVDWCYAPLEHVQAAFRGAVGDGDVRLIKGDVNETLRVEANLPNQISVLRLDTDFYDSTKVELEVLYPRLSSGGVLILDDYGVWAGQRKAFDEYFRGRPVGWLHYVNHSVRLLIKP